MTTARDICTRALRRIRVVDAREQPDPDDSDLALSELNDMMFGWASDGIDVQHAEMTLNSTFAMFVPPKPNALADRRAEARLASALAVIKSQGAWDANTNTPALATSTGTLGHLYKVSVAGATVLDGITSWAVNDFALFDGTYWLKGQSSRPYEGGVSALLAVRLAPDFGTDMAPAQTMQLADATWTALNDAFAVPAEPQFDRGLSWTPSRRYVDYY